MPNDVRLSVGSRRITSPGPGTAATYDARAGLKEVRKNLLKVLASIENASPQALEYALEPIFEESQRLVPKDTRTLMQSGFIEARKKSGGAHAAVGYAKAGRPFYAAIVHERLDVYHEPPTRAKFLEGAVQMHLDKVLPRYVEFMRSATGVTP